MWTFHGGTVVLTCCVIVLIHFFFSNCNIFCTKFDSKLCRRIGENHNNLQSRNQRLINFASEEVKSYRSFHDFPYSLNYVNSLRFYVLNDSDSSDLADGMLSVKQRFHEYFVSDSGKDFQDAIKLLFVQSPLDKKVRRRIKVIVSDANLVTIYFSERIG